MITFFSKVKKVEHKSRIARAWKEADRVCTKEDDLGWFLLLEGSWEYLYVGAQRPVFEVGDEVVVSIRRR